MKIGLIGTIGVKHNTTSGQEIRTRILYQSMQDHYGKDGVYLVDTRLTKTNLIKFLGSLCYSLIFCNKIVLIVSRNGLRIFLPLLSFLQKFFHKKVYNNIIGGNILELIRDNPKYIKYMKNFSVNWVQMKQMVDGLKKLGIDNAEILPNSKPIHIQKNLVEKANNKPYQLCTFSRISKEKGTELAIRTIEEINAEYADKVVELTIFGKPDEDYAEKFDYLMKNATDCIHYDGIIDYDSSTEILSQYFMLLFPTTFYGEGFPGTILDAYASGLPVIASSWKFNPELIQDGTTGYVYDYKNPNQLKHIIKYAIDNSQKVESMRKNCLSESLKYIPENVMPIIFNKIDSE